MRIRKGFSEVAWVQRVVPFFLFFLSGFSGLVYEMVWSRMMVLVFGNTTQATSIILSSFMAGLALGGYLWGRYSRLWSKGPLTLFGLLEMATGLYAVLFPLLLSLVTPVEIRLSEILNPAHQSIAVLRGAICFSILLPPTLMMGGTFAILGRHLIRAHDEIGRKSALLYGLNTAGAMIGAGMTGFFLLNHLGQSGSTYLAAGINMAVAAAALAIGRTGEPDGKVETGSTLAKGAEAGTRFVPVLVALAVSGFCGLGYEVLWTRLLLLVVDNSIYSFTAILAGFLGGIAIGSLSIAPLARRLRNPTLLFGLSQLGIGLLAYYFPVLVQIGPVQGTVHYYAFLCQAVFLVVFLSAALMGMALPLSLWIRGGSTTTAAYHMGSLFAVNTLGAVAGSILTGFLLIPFLGLQNSSLLLAALNWLIGGALVWSSLAGVVRTGYAAGLAVLLALGLLLAPHDLMKEKHSALAGGGRMVFYKEGLSATTTIMERPSGERILFLNGIPQVQNDPTSMKTFGLMGALPCLLQEKPGRGLAITFGAGITSGVMAGFLDTLDCVELVDEAPEIAGCFSVENGDVLKRGNVRLHIDDARHFLLRGRERYGVIVADATHPRGYDSWVLFTREFYELLKRRLERGGIFVQWVPFHGMTLEQYMAIAKTFQAVFPNSSIWSVDGAHSLLLGFAGADKIDFGRVLSRMSEPQVRSDLSPFGLDDLSVLFSLFCMGKVGMDKMLAKFPEIITDDSPKHLFFPITATFGEQYGQWPEANSRYLEERKESIVPYLSNIGDSEEQRKANLRRLRTPRRSR